MKKIMSFALAIVMAAAMPVAAFAEEAGNNKGAGSWDVPVTGVYQAGSSAAGEKVSVDISWGSMEFTYTDASQGGWNPANHDYDEGASAKWTAIGNTITVKNHSNVGINAKFSFAASEDLNLTYDFKKGETKVTDAGVDIESANDAKYQTAGEDGTYPAPAAEVTFNITDGAITKGTTDLGKITVSIRSNNSSNSDNENKTLSVYTSSSPTWYTRGTETTAELSVTSATLYDFSDGFSYTDVPETEFAHVTWRLEGNSSSTTKLSTTTGATTTLTIGSDETEKLEIYAVLTYDGVTAEGFTRINNSPTINGVNTYYREEDGTAGEVIGWQGEYVSGENRFITLIYEEYEGDITSYDKKDAYSGETLEMLRDKISYMIVEGRNDFDRTESLEIPGVTLTQDATEKEKFTLTVPDDYTGTIYIKTHVDDYTLITALAPKSGAE